MNTPGVAAAPNTQLRENFMTTYYHSPHRRQPKHSEGNPVKQEHQYHKTAVVQWDHACFGVRILSTVRV
ncbi:hypothetical protein E2C01_072600 [Portunus trituberculatus]|uniref:Uncharacterized protein n=1 Tax=Portunus trituberculatus TaxID=210409 RepID=A0A5B7HYG7_PORTR|nr:hypothetical protein [Portunus trituberculatus]